MAIDADLSAGLIDEKAAKERRKALEDESGFFGAMDGASKFVRGDAVAGLLVVFINIIGGIIIGLLETFTSGYISPSLRDVIPYIVLVFILLVKPYGLFGLVEIERV